MMASSRLPRQLSEVHLQFRFIFIKQVIHYWVVSIHIRERILKK